MNPSKNTKYYIRNTIYWSVIVIAIVFMSLKALAATWDVKPYLFEYISEKIVGRTIYIVFKVLDDRCVEMRPGLTGEIDWDDGEVTKLERLNCETWYIPHIYKIAKTYTITVKIEDLTAEIPNVTITEADFASSMGVPSSGTPPPAGSLQPIPSFPSLSTVPPLEPSPPAGGSILDFTANFSCNKTEIAIEEELECQATGLPLDANPAEFDFNWSLSSSCEDEDFPLEGQGENQIIHIFSKASSCYINLTVIHLSSQVKKDGTAALIKVKEKSALRNFFDSLFAFLNPPRRPIKKVKEEIAIAEVKKSQNQGNVSVKIITNPKDLKISSCKLNFGDGTYQAINDFSREIRYQYQNSGAYVLTLSCLGEKKKELRSSFGVEIDIIH